MNDDNVIKCDFFFFFFNVVECDFRLFFSNYKEIAFHSLFAFFSTFVMRSRIRIWWQMKNDYASSFNITWFWEDCTWSKIMQQNDKSNESKWRKSNVFWMTTNVINVTNLTNLTNVTNVVIVFFFKKIKEIF
jgi:hypothetical protein